ncbi:MAG TPA: valine--tRNA ligase [Acidobacteriota bacterium]|nr:valine--tRNA ligase [Acidobacteriota bacterium]
MSRELLQKVYDPAQVEAKWYPFWEQRGYFTADNTSTKPRFCIVIPPPNVTGSLHMGHALQHTLHDILVRWKRMSGYNTLWLPGTDHASIAVHYVLDKQLEQQKKTRFDLGREEFLKLAWQWKKTSGGTILNQMRRLGVSVDWTRERFTMDEGLSRAVQEVFIRLYEEGLIYRGEYIVNWCPRCKTAISDLEVVYVPTHGKLWHIKYPLIGSEGHVSVATTRPETMLGDTAVAVHPEDPRYQSLVGGKVLLPVMNREIPVIADSIVDREFGTGVVKVTPAHDAHDYEAGLRHNLRKITVIDESGTMTKEAGAYAGMDRFACRHELVERLAADGFLLKVEDYEHNVGHCDRCSAVVEPKISMQWYLKVESLAKPAIEVVENGKIQFVPDNFKKRYFEWMYNIHDWCISRQLWWGHRIPAWYCDACGQIIVSRTTPQACSKCGGALRAETDILDTWFSSALWPFSTLGWPDDTQDLRVFYPTDVLITGPDIIFFWVARMIMMGLKFMKDVPFRQVHINGIVRDASRKKMSKTRGNVIEPLELVDQYGADAVRFTLSSMAVPGTDIPFSTDRMKGYSAFANKVWNAARFVLMNLDETQSPVSAATVDELLAKKRDQMPLEDLWILHRLNQVSGEISEALDKFRFHDASSLIYQFIWHELCDWYIELVKPVLTSPSAKGEEKERRITVLIHALDSALRILHPFMPYLTEEIWQKVPHNGESIMIQEFPQPRRVREDAAAAQDMQDLMDLIVSVRSSRAELNIDPKKMLDCAVVIPDLRTREHVRQNAEKIKYLARLGRVDFADAVPGGMLKGVWRLGEFGLAIQGVIDYEAERDRLQRELERTRGEIEKILKKINSHEFIARAPESVVEENRARHTELIERMQKLETNLNQLPSAAE